VDGKIFDEELFVLTMFLQICSKIFYSKILSFVDGTANNQKWGL
jgi:hypothetical protein